MLIRLKLESYSDGSQPVRKAGSKAAQMKNSKEGAAQSAA
jgi:hypothetical protein